MGNSASNANNRPSSIHNRRVDSPRRGSSRPQSPSPQPSSSSNLAPHRSLRTKKKSLELPDLASLALSPASSAHGSPVGHYRRPARTSSPIPIPTSPTNNNNTSRGRRPTLPSTQALPDILVEQPPSTHIPVNQRPRTNPFIRGAPIQYNSTHSFVNRGQNRQPRMQELPAGRTPVPRAFIQETVQSTIPLALDEVRKVQSPTPGVGDDMGTSISRPKTASDDRKEPVSVKITWRGGGKSVVLARAGDDNWKGRQPMERENPSSDSTWSTWVPLLPGTHHIKFIVDEQWRVADDLPTAVDDDGSLANYVAVPISGFTPPSTATPAPPVSPPATVRLQPGQSFWSASSSNSGTGPSSSDERGNPSQWTSEFPLELIAAAREEEAYLNSSSTASDSVSTLGIPAPNIPPAPALPRHLDKLILNVRVSPGVSTGTRPRDREREREERRSSRKSKPQANNTAQDHPSVMVTSSANATTTVISLEPATGNGPTVSGTATISRAMLDGPGLADDTSVLPVPSHVVLHHLTTSAIKNGVLAVGSTTRYKKKFLTTIYYKPT